MYASAQAVRPLIRNISQVTPLGLLKTKKKVSAAPPPHLTGQRASPAKTMCRQKLRNEVPAARNLALSCHPPSLGKRPVLARLSGSALSLQMRFSAALENLRWVGSISRTKPDVSRGRFRSRRGNVAACRSAATEGLTTPRAQHLRWLRAITNAGAANIRAQNAKILAETERDERRRQRRGRPFKPSADKRNQAVQAFWAMHVEKLNWSGMTLTHCAAAAKISKSSLRRRRDLIDGGEVKIDWRAQLHPSARLQISSDVSSAAKKRSAETVLTTSPPGDPPRDRQSNRRSFTDEEKLAIVLVAE